MPQEEVAKFQTRGQIDQVSRKVSGPLGYVPPAQQPPRNKGSVPSKKAEAKRRKWVSYSLLQFMFFAVYLQRCIFNRLLSACREKEAAETAARTPSPSSHVAADEVDEKSALVKNMKGLKKKLRGVSELEAKVATGEVLNEDQAAKFATRADLEAALKEAEAALAALEV